MYHITSSGSAHVSPSVRRRHGLTAFVSSLIYSFYSPRIALSLSHPHSYAPSKRPKTLWRVSALPVSFSSSVACFFVFSFVSSSRQALAHSYSYNIPLPHISWNLLYYLSLPLHRCTDPFHPSPLISRHAHLFCLSLSLFLSLSLSSSLSTSLPPRFFCFILRVRMPGLGSSDTICVTASNVSFSLETRFPHTYIRYARLRESETDKTLFRSPSSSRFNIQCSARVLFRTRSIYKVRVLTEVYNTYSQASPIIQFSRSHIGPHATAESSSVSVTCWVQS